MSDDFDSCPILTPFSPNAKIKKRKQDVAPQNEELKQKCPTLLRQNVSPEPIETAHYSDPNTLPSFARRKCDLLTKFLVSEGLSFELLNNEVFRKLLVQLDPHFIFPTLSLLSKMTETMRAPETFQANFWKLMRPISITMDVVEKNKGDHYLAFTVHYFESFDDRNCLVFLRKMLRNEINADSTILCIRRAISHLNYSNIKIGNLVLPDPRIAGLIRRSPSQDNFIKEQFISFHYYISKFANNILKLHEFATAIEQLRNFVSFIKLNAYLHDSFRKFQSIRKEDLNLPALDDEDSWQSTTAFLARCIVLHYAFSEFVERAKIDGYISDQTFGKLTFLFQVLQQCAKHAKSLSGPLNSISQIIPTVMSIRNYITRCLSFGFSFEKDIRDEFSSVFQGLSSGPKSREYDIATIMDPRFAYDTTIYSKATWSSIEKLVMERVLHMPIAETETKIEKSFLKSFCTPKIITINAELSVYKNMCSSLKTRPEEQDNPFKWWAVAQDILPILAVVAKDALACPAVTIDAQYFFGTNGKFSRLCETYDSEQLQSYLNAASSQQQFRGYGAVGDGILPRMLSALNQNIFRRRQVDAQAMNEIKKLKRRVMPVINIRENKNYLTKKGGSSQHITSQLSEEVVQEPNGSIEMEMKPEPKDVIEMEVKLEPNEETEREIKMEPVEVEDPSNVCIAEYSEFPSQYHHIDPAVKMEVSEEKDQSTNSSDENIRIPNTLPTRRCTLCNKLIPLATPNFITSENEKTFLLLGGVLLKIIDREQACTKFNNQQPFFCQSHIQEAAEAVMKILNVQNPGEIMDCDEIILNRVLDMMSSIKQFTTNFTFVKAKVFLTSFINRFWTPPEPSPKKARMIEGSLVNKPIRTMKKERIIPKKLRQPRKQVLKNDLEEKANMIEKDDGSERTVTCSFCQMTASRCYVVKVSKSKAQLESWESKLGEEFMKRLDYDQENYVCKAHFSCGTFSSRGRLLKRHLSDTDSETTTNYVFRDAKPKRVKQENSENQLEDIKQEDLEFKTCALCSLSENVEEMKQVPKNEKELEKWTKKFGKFFIKNLESNSNNFVCSKHFKEEVDPIYEP